MAALKMHKVRAEALVGETVVSTHDPLGGLCLGDSPVCLTS